MGFRKLMLGAKLGSIVVLIIAAHSMEAGAIPTDDGQVNQKMSTAEEIRVTAVREGESPFLPNVHGTKIHAGKKTSRVDLNDLPAISNNNYRQALLSIGILTGRCN